MESRVIALYDYHKVDLSACADQNHAPSLTCVRLEFVPDEAVIEDELQRFANRKAVWKEIRCILGIP